MTNSNAAPFRLAVGVALELVVVTTSVVIFVANLPWISDCHEAGDCPSPLPWIMADATGEVAFLLWFLAAALIPALVGEWARQSRWRRMCLATIMVSGVVGTTIGMLLTSWLFPTAYAHVWHAPIKQWIAISTMTTVASTLLVGGPALLFANAWTQYELID